MKKFADPFLIGLLCMILLAFLFPGMESPLHLTEVIRYGVALIFFFYGLKLDLSQLKQDLGNWKLHVGIHSITFLAFPLLVLAFYPLAKGSSYEDLWLGLFFLAALPSTVSSAVVMVAIARGNMPGAIFNASISGLIGVFLTPMWIGFFLNTEALSGNAFIDVVADLVIQILLPLLAGVSLNRYFGKFFSRYASQLAWFDKSIIWLIIYKSFSQSFSSGIFTSFGVEKVLIMFACVAFMFTLVLTLSTKLAEWLRFSIEDKITLSFCGTKKSLIHGTVMAAVIFGGAPGTGIYILPILIYHPLQIFVVSILAQRYASRAEVPS